jgi:hypothetical protein
MRLTFMVSLGLFALMSCNQSTTTSTSADSLKPADAAASEDVSYAYTIEHPDQWEWGSKKNTETALNALKGFETGDIAGTMKYWGDSVKLEFDNFDKKVSNDSLKAMFTAWRGNFKDLRIQMEDFESVVSKDKKKEYVSLWYKEYITNSKGEQDSVQCMDDLLFENGKIVLLNEKTRKLGPPKK